MNYSELKTAVLSYIDHDEENDVEFWIELARAVINRKLRAREMICVATTECDGESSAYTIPSDWGGARTLSLDDEDLKYCTPETLDGHGSEYYTILGTKIRLGEIPAEGSELKMAYYKKVPRLDEDEDTNWLLERHPDCWLAGAVSQGHKYTMDEQRAAYWSGECDKIIEEILLQDWTDRWSGGSLEIRPYHV